MSHYISFRPAIDIIMLSVVIAKKSTAFLREGQKIARVQLVHSRFSSHLKSCDVADNNAKVKAYARMILTQKIEVLNQISCEDYTKRILLSSSIGAHMRHSLDHFIVVLNANAENTVLDYDTRERNTDTEVIRMNALKVCDNLLKRLHE